MQVITVGRAEGSSRLAAGLFNLRVTLAAQFCEVRSLDEDSRTKGLGWAVDGLGCCGSGGCHAGKV